jgi:hypothetical protein
MGDRKKVKEMNYQRLFIILLRTVLLFGLIIALQSPDNVLAQTPTPFLITPYFGQAALTQGYHGGHQALDFGLSYQRVLAASSGIVDRVQWWNNNCHQFWNPPEQGGDTANCAFGLHLRIDHGNGYRTWYAHHSSVAFNLGTTNSYAGQGQIVGTSGHTGYSSGPHLHFQTQRFVNGIWTNVNPENPCLWQDGHRINICNSNQPSRPIPEPPTNGEIIVDDNNNNGGGFSKGRSAPFNMPCPPNSCEHWYPVIAGYGNDMYYTFVNGNIADYWARWQPDGIPAGGSIYEIFVHVPNVNATTWQAPYTIVHGLGQTTAVVDQFGLHNQWVSIGTYYLRPGDYVYTTDATGEGQGVHCGAGQWCRLGVDAVKFVRLGTTHIPSVRTDSGWTTSIITRSNGGDARFSFRYYSNNGTPLCGGSSVVPARGTIVLPSCIGAVSAVIDATQDIAVVVKTDYNGEPSGYVGPTAAGGSGSPGWERAGSTLYVPLVKNNHYGRWSNIYVFNAGSQSTVISVTYFDANGTWIGGGSFSVAPNGQRVLTPVGYTSSGVFSARISSSNGQPLVAVVQEGESNPPTTWPAMYNAFSSSGTNLYAPTVKKNFYGHTTGMTIQNVGSNTANVQTQYYNMDGGLVTSFSVTIPSNAPYVIVNPGQVPDGFLGSVRITSTNGQPLVGQVTESGGSSGRRMMASLPLSGSQTIFFPLWYDRYLVGGDWRSGINIRNVGSGSATITARWYSQAGALVHTETATLINANDTHNFVDNTPDNFIGTVMIQSSGQPIVAIENNRNYAGSGDTTFAVNGSNR